MINIDPTTMRSRFLRNARWAFASIFFRYFFSFFVTLLLARRLGATVFGDYQYYLSLFAVIESFTLVFDYSVAQTDLIKGSVSFEKLWGSMRVIVPALGLFVLLLAAGVNSFLHWETKTEYLVFICFSLVFKFGDFLSVRLRAELDQHLQQASEIVVLVVFNCARAAVVLMNLDFIWLLSCTILSYALLTLSYLILFQRKPNLSLKGEFDWPTVLSLAKRSLPIYTITVLSVSQSRITNLILPQITTKAELGLFSFASKLIDPVYSVCTLAFATAMPFLAHSFVSSTFLYQKQLSRIMGITIIMVVITFIGSLVLPTPMILAVINPDFIGASKLLPILTLSLIGQAFSAICNYSDVLGQRYAFSLFRNAFILIAQTVFSTLAIHRWGVIGAAVTVAMVPLLSNLTANQVRAETRYLNQILLTKLRPSHFKEIIVDLFKSLADALRRK